MKDKFLTGAVGLQVNHATRERQYTKFRNIYIRNLDLEPEYVTKGFYETGPRWRKQAHAAAVSLGAGMIGQLTDMMSGDNPMAKSGTKQALFDITAKASAPGTLKEDREAIAGALKKSAKKVTSESTQSYLEWLLGMID